jgi:hypothetical protein
MLPAVRDQDGCGSCWAFGAIGAMECALARESNISVDLAEQWLVSCTTAGSCDGGWHSTALEYLTCGGQQDTCGGNGAVLESSFPYEAWDVPCDCPYEHPYCLDSWLMLGSEYTEATVAQIKQAIYDHGPVAAAVHAGSYAFMAYTGGIFNACESAPTDHVIVLVGWDDSQGGGVWFLRNSWGPYWGEGGYMRITYGCCRVGEATAYVNYLPPDCNHNGVADRDDIASGTSVDCNGNDIPDECEPQGDTDCNGNAASDLCDLYRGTSADCNANGIPDECDIADGSATDCNTNGIPDACELNVVYQTDHGTADAFVGSPVIGDLIWLNTFTAQADAQVINAIDIAWGWVAPDTPTTLAIWRDPTNDRDPHDAELLWKTPATVPVSDPYTDLFTTVSVPDVPVGSPGDVFFVGAYMHTSSYPAPIDLSVSPGHAWAAEGSNLDHLAANNGTLVCMDNDPWLEGGAWLLRAHARSNDCNMNLVPDTCEIAAGTSSDCNGNGVADECETDLGVVITADPASLSICEGDAATFNVTAQGAGRLAYQWRHEGVPISGATASTYTIPAATADEAGLYDVVVSSTCASSPQSVMTSADATLTVDHPRILTQPHDQDAIVGDTITFSVVAESLQDLTYQWLKDGQPLADAVLTSYTVRAATLADAGQYSVVVGGCRSVTSAPATLTVNLAGAATPSPYNGAENVPLDVELRWDAVPEADRYDVYLGTSATMALSGTTPTHSWTPGYLAYSTKYFWKVVARAGTASTEGLIWWFTTEPEPVPLPGVPFAPSPADGATSVLRNVELSWGAASGAEVYKVLLGESEALASDTRLVTSTDECRTCPSGLAPGATYYWQVIAKNAGGQTVGPVWSFTTETEVSPPDSNEPADSNSPADSNEPAPSEPNTPDDNTVDPNAAPSDNSAVTTPANAGVLCPGTSAALVLAMWLGLRPLHGRRARP